MTCARESSSASAAATSAASSTSTTSPHTPARIPGVSSVAINQFMCGTEGHDLISEAVEDRGLDHLIVASCSPRFQGPTFERIARELRLGENAVAFANLREGCSFIHKDQPELAQEKARKILEGADRAGAAPERPAPAAHVPHALGARGRRRHRRHDRRRGTRGQRHDVHLVERQPSPGRLHGAPQQDFPTEDCAMCSLAPRLTSTALEGRVHVHTLTEVDQITGPPGKSGVDPAPQAALRQRSLRRLRRVRPVCPVRVLERFRLRGQRSARRSTASSNAVPSTFADREEGLEPVQERLRRATSAQGYVALVAAGRFKEAYDLTRSLSLPGGCGRICPHPCETACARGKVDEPIAIAA